MAKLVYGLNLSLDGYVDHQKFEPGPELFHYFIEQMRGLAGSVYGRRMYEVMRYWAHYIQPALSSTISRRNSKCRPAWKNVNNCGVNHLSRV